MGSDVPGFEGILTPLPHTPDFPYPEDNFLEDLV